MEPPNPQSPAAVMPAEAETTTTAEEEAAKAATKRYETLATIRSKAIKGKGAWYWAHLEPLLLLSDAGAPKAAKLRCTLCDATFSASNPSRTSNDHLKKGSCPNFVSSSSSSAAPIPISSAPPPPLPTMRRKRPSRPKPMLLNPASASSSARPLLLPCPPQRFDKEELGALAMLEDSVKRLKSPKPSPGPPLARPQAEAALSSLAHWIFESCGSVGFTCFTHPKFKAFLHQVGLPPLDPRQLAGPVLDSRHRDAASDADAKIRDAPFFQLSSSGWLRRRNAQNNEHKFVNVSANLPNGATVFHRALLTVESAPPEYAEEVLRDALHGTMGGVGERCVGIVADGFRSKALLNLSNRYHWMLNLCCQARAIGSLVKDFARELLLFETAVASCFKVATYFNRQPQVRSVFTKYRVRESDRVGLIRAPLDVEDAITNFGPVFSMLEDVMGSAGSFQLTVLDEDYKTVCAEDREAEELAELVRDGRFWNDVEAVHSVVKLIKEMVSEMEVERPLVGECLPLWNELRSKVRDWCNKFNIEFEPVDKLIEKRFKKNYHPAWSLAFILDPLYLIKDASGKYLPPFKLLTPEQEKDVDKLITKLVSREEAHIALMELMKWRSEGLDPLYAQAVQLKQPDPVTGKMRTANPQSSRLVWETCLSELKTLGKVAIRVIFLHATASSFGLSSSPPVLKWVSGQNRSRVAVERAQKMVAVAAHAKIERRDFTNEEKDAEILNEVENGAMDEAPSV